MRPTDLLHRGKALSGEILSFIPLKSIAFQIFSGAGRRGPDRPGAENFSKTRGNTPGPLSDGCDFVKAATTALCERSASFDHSRLRGTHRFGCYLYSFACWRWNMQPCCACSVFSCVDSSFFYGFYTGSALSQERSSGDPPRKFHGRKINMLRNLFQRSPSFSGVRLHRYRTFTPGSLLYL